MSSSSQITNIGITSVVDDSPHLDGENIPKLWVPRNVPALHGTISIGLFFSAAKLSNVWRLDVRKMERRCIGMCLYYSDDTVEVLGQWDPSQSSEAIYVKDTKVLESLTFHLSGPILSSFVENITINDGPSTLKSRSNHRQTFLKNQVCIFLR